MLGSTHEVQQQLDGDVILLQRNDIAAALNNMLDTKNQLAGSPSTVGAVALRRYQDDEHLINNLTDACLEQPLSLILRFPDTVDALQNQMVRHLACLWTMKVWWRFANSYVRIPFSDKYLYREAMVDYLNISRQSMEIDDMAIKDSSW